MRPVNGPVSVDPVRRYLLRLQDTICDALEREDGAAVFRVDDWSRDSARDHERGPGSSSVESVS